MNHLIRANHFHNQYDNLVKSLGEFDWDDICEVFSSHQTRTKKEEVALFNFVRYREVDTDHLDDNTGFLPNTGQLVPLRRKINLVQVDALVLDYDGGMTIDEAKHRFAEYEYLGYTSYNHLRDGETHKFRLIIPLAVTIPVNPRLKSLPTYYELEIPLGLFAGDCDPVVFNPNQMYYVPATHPDRLHLACSWVNHGEILDWRTWEIPEQVDVLVDSSNPNRPLIARGINNQLDPETEFVTMEGVIKAKDVHKTYQKVRCPFHEDKSGGEFLKRFDDSGVVYFKCKHCGGFSLHPTDIKEQAEIKLSTMSSAVMEEFEFGKEYLHPDMIDRGPIRKELQQIAKHILNDRNPHQKRFRYNTPNAHIVYLPEGSGKSQLAVDMVRQGVPVIFACQTWEQVYEKQREFQKALYSDNPDKNINVRIANSFESRFRHKWGLKTLRESGQGGYKTRDIDKEATIEQIIAQYPHVSRRYIEFWWHLFSHDNEKISQTMYKAMEYHELMSVQWDDDVGFVIDEWMEPNDIREVGFNEEWVKIRKRSGMVITTFSQLRLLRMRGDALPKEWIIWFDDPGMDDVANISPFEETSSVEVANSPPELPNINEINEGDANQLQHITEQLSESHGYSSDEVVALVKQLAIHDDEDSTPVRKSNQPLKINGVLYHRRPHHLGLGYSTLKHRMVFTTTELLTKNALTKHLETLWKPPVIHEMMEKIPFGQITVLGTDKVRRSQDAIIPIILRRLEKKNIPVQLIADGLGSHYNHTNSKGVNVLTETDLIVEVSIPHPSEVKKFCAVLDLDFTTHQQEITVNLMMDKIHQAVGRNSGYRWTGKECIVLVDKRYHKDIIKTIRYGIDPENSVVIDRTQRMSTKEKRITPTASPLTKLIEEHLNNVDKVFDDRRSIIPCIDYVIKQIEDSEKRCLYISRLLTALSTLSKTSLEKPKDSTKTEPHRIENYRHLWNHIETTWINVSNRTRIMKDYQSNKKDNDKIPPVTIESIH